MPRKLPYLLSVLPLAALLAGCVEAPTKPDPAVVNALRQKYLLEVEPADAATPLDWRDSRDEEGPVDVLATLDAPDGAAPEPTDPDRIVLVGQVGGMPNPWGAENEPDFPWKEGQATFFLVDPSTVAEFASHAEAEGLEHAEDCPFCSREAANKTSSVAVVTFAAPEDPSKPAPVDTRDLFGLKVGDLVVVRGTWELKGDVLLVDADGLFRRQ